MLSLSERTGDDFVPRVAPTLGTKFAKHHIPNEGARWLGNDDVWYGLAWNTVSVPWVFDGDLAGITTSGRR